MADRTTVVASVIGVVAGLLGTYHGYNETLQGNTAPTGLMINAIGPPCQGNGCFPAMTVIPDFWVTGILAILVSLVVIGWAIVFVGRKNGGTALIVLSIVLLLVGGGFLPPLLGILAGAIGTRIKREGVSMMTPAPGNPPNP